MKKKGANVFGLNSISDQRRSPHILFNSILVLSSLPAHSPKKYNRKYSNKISPKNKISKDKPDAYRFHEFLKKQLNSKQTGNKLENNEKRTKRRNFVNDSSKGKRATVCSQWSPCKPSQTLSLRKMTRLKTLENS